MRLTLKCALLFVLALSIWQSAWAADGIITVTPFPSVAVADSRSTITVTAEIQDQQGHKVPDGTQVVFETDIGSFQTNILTTVNGHATAILVAPSVAGIANIKVTALTFKAVTTYQYEFVASKSLLSSAKEYIELITKRYMVYSPETKIADAAASGQGVHLRYKDIDIVADQIQLSVREYVVKARNAKIRVGKVTRNVDQVNYNLKLRSGIAVGKFTKQQKKLIILFPMPSEELTEFDTFGTMKLTGLQAEAFTDILPKKTFENADMTESSTLVSCNKMTAYPKRDIYFERASVMLNGRRLLNVPLYSLSAAADIPTLSDQMFNVSNNKIAINYPYYTSLKPGLSSLLRFRSGALYSTGSGGGGGTSLDYEWRWNSGDQAEGSLTFSGLARKDWGLFARHFTRFDDHTSGSFTLDFPSNSSLFGSANLSKQLGKWNLNANSLTGRAVRGARFNSQTGFMTLEHEPQAINRLPLRLFYGLTASLNKFTSSVANSSQKTIGLRTRVQAKTWRVNKRLALDSDFSLSRLFMNGGRSSFAKGANVYAMATLSNSASARFGYEFLDDGFNSKFLGRHRLSATGYWTAGALDLSFSASKSIDINRYSTFLDGSWRLSNQWRFGGSYSIDQFTNSSFRDFSFILGYTLGIREVGLSWSNRTHRFGIEVLGTRLR